MPSVAYSPLLFLIKSHVAVYKIYTLTNPITEEIFYVGQTSQNLETRLSGHCLESESNKPKVEYIQNLIKQGYKPKIDVIETIQGTCYIDKVLLNERERYWIKYYKTVGCNLLNIAATNDAYISEYNQYLSCIKRGEAQRHYYYCGITIGGYEVYDEKKLNADGFKLTHSATYTYQSEEKTGYDPWDNPRWKKKIGYRVSPYDELSYVPCYNDENPDYYDEDY